MLLSWGVLKVSRLQELNIRRSPQKTRRDNGLSRRLKKATKKVPQRGQIKIEDINSYKRYVYVRQDYLVHNSK